MLNFIVKTLASLVVVQITKGITKKDVVYSVIGAAISSKFPKK